MKELSNVLKKTLISRLEAELKNGLFETHVFDPGNFDNSELSRFIKDKKLKQEEIIILLISLVPHISPEFFNSIIYKYLPNGGDFPEFGGTKGKNHRGILPTGETVLFVLPGNNIEKLTGMSNVVLK